MSDSDIMTHKELPGIYYYTDNNTGVTRLVTRNLAPGSRVYGEMLIKSAGEEYRYWEPNRSKLAAVILRGMKPSCIPIKPGSIILYLGAGSGTTPSHISDIIGEEGIVFCIESSPRSTRDLVATSNLRPNMIPILADARHPRSYSSLVTQVDAIYCDVAQPEQAKLLNKNASWFLKRDGEIMLAIKARSIDVTMEPSQVFKREISKMSPHFIICDRQNLRPYHKDHVMVSAKYSDHTK